jgi:predicted PurR-regulated permease PerM
MKPPQSLILILVTIALVGIFTTIGLWLLDAPQPAFVALLTTTAALALLQLLPEESP